MRSELRRVTARAALAALAVTGLVLRIEPEAAASTAPAMPAGDHWVAGWTASPTDAATPFDAAGLPTPVAVDDQTIRMVVTPHLGGTTLRIHLSNRFGARSVTFGHVTVGDAAGRGATAITGVTFGGARQVTAPPGDDVVSDPVAFDFAAFQPLAVSIYVAGATTAPTKHWNANATSYYAPPLTGDLAGTGSGLLFAATTEAWFYVDGIDVAAPATESGIVAFGDSITDGFVASNPLSIPVTLSVADKNGRYPDDLQRLLDQNGRPDAVANEGIASNRLVTDGEPLFLGPSGVRRFGQDALDVAGVKTVILLEGINDLGIPPATTTPAQLIAGYEQVIAMAHAAHVRIWLGTITPASNAALDGTTTAPNSENYREQVNAWIRSQHLADGVIDFDAALRDPADPHVLDPAYAGPDHLHPNLAGYQVMAATAYQALFGR